MLIQFPRDNLLEIAREIRSELRKHPDGGEHRVELPNGDVVKIFVEPSALATHWVVRVEWPDGQAVKETVGKAYFLRVLPDFVRSCTKTRAVATI